MRLLIATAALLVFSGTSLADDVPAPGQILQFGLGLHSCATWLGDPATENQGDNWLLGYWTGMNEARGDQRGVARGIIAEVKKRCNDQPSLTLREATADVYWELYRAKR